MSSNFTSFAGMDVLFVMAADAEYGPHLRQRIRPLMTGIGPIEAAISLGCALARTDALPNLVVSLGSAGSRVLKQGQVYQVSSVAYRDMDASALGFERGRTPFLDLPAEIDMPHLIANLPQASLSTGANIVSGAQYEAIAQQMVDMETFAHLRVAQRFGLPLIGLRGISDGAEELRALSDWTQYLHVIDKQLASAIDALEQALLQGELRL